VSAVRLDFGLPVSGSWATPANMVAIARRTEELGYASLLFTAVGVPYERRDARAEEFLWLSRATPA
jgi:hypothetical protein